MSRAVRLQLPRLPGRILTLNTQPIAGDVGQTGVGRGEPVSAHGPLVESSTSWCSRGPNPKGHAER